MSSTSSIRNLAFVGHPSAGKTTLVDALAHLTGASPRKGSVADKSSICDTDPEEQEKGHTLSLASVAASWSDRSWTFVDTPGYPEFVADVQSALFACELAVGVASCSSGATFNLRQKMNAARAMGRGRAVIVTHLDGENADFEEIVEDLRTKIGEECVPVLLPDASGPSFSSVERTILHPENDWCSRLKDRVMDACEDEDLLMEYLESQEITEEQLDEHMPKAIAAGALVPVLVCNPESGVGLENVLEFLKRFGPSPLDVPARDADGNAISGEGAACGTVFAIRSDPHVGKICMIKLLRGELGAHDTVVGADGGKGEKMGGLFKMVGKNREAVESIGAGEIAAFSKVDALATWSAFAVSGGDPVVAPTPTVPESTVSLAVFPKSRADEQKIGEALHKLTAEDPTFRVQNNPETHELIVSGMSDLHLDVMLARMKRRYGVDVDTKLPKISYRQTITKNADGHHRHKKQSGGRGQFGECFMRVRPAKEGDEVEFVDKIVGGAIPRNLIPAVEKGVREIASNGILCDGAVVGVEVELYDGKFHAVDSDEASFKLAGARAFRDGFEKAGPVLLEPIMRVEIHVPTSEAGTIFSDITSQRRGQVHDQESEADGSITKIVAEAPLSTLQTYHRDLKSQTAGEGFFAMTFAHFAPVPAQEQSKILAAIGKKHDEE